MMKYSAWMAATALATALTLPLAASAQQPKPAAVAAPAPHAAPAARAAPAPRAAAPHFAAPHAAAQHFVAPQRAAAPHFAPQRAAAPRISAPQRAAIPQATQRRAVERTSPRVNSRAAQRFEQNRATRTTQTNTARVQSQARSQVQSSSAAVQSLSPAAQRRADRVERRNEQRVLRSLPASQRAAKREEFRQQRLNARANAQSNTAARSNATLQSNATVARSARTQQRSARRNGGTALTAQAARQGRFASRFAGRSALAAADPMAARRAWHRHHRAAFVGWYGPVFWPYAYSDIFDYAFWPNGYDVGYWDYAYDDFIDGLFWGEQGPPAEYVEGAPGTASATALSKVSYAGVQELCTQPGSGVTAWPFADITSKVGLNAEQKSLLDQMRSAATKAAAVFKASCPANDAFPLTPPGRLTAMTGRLDATLQAVDTVKPALEAFYNSLNDEQKERFNELGPSTQVAKAGSETTGAIAQDGNSCKQPKPGLANLPIDKIEDVIKPTEAQETSLDALHDATEKAVAIMQAACPDETPLTPTGRLDAMQKRLQAMIDAANTVKPALTDFYASLSSEQKARFNRIGQELAQSGG
jgi:LTXXQ motif family protein